MRERLTSLISEAEGLVNNDLPTVEQIADYLIEHGVIVPPCKVGDRVWVHIGLGNIIAVIVTRIETTETPSGAKRIYFAIGVDSPSVSFNDDCIGKTVFLSREEAEKALAERSAE